MEPPVSVERDPEAVSIRFHNRTGTELVVKPYVRKALEETAVGGVYRLTPTDEAAQDKDKPDLELAVFKFLPAKREEIGAYCIEVTSPSSEARMAVIDLTNQEMTMAKASGRLTYVFRPDAITVVIGTTTTTVPWVRALPNAPDRSKS